VGGDGKEEHRRRKRGTVTEIVGENGINKEEMEKRRRREKEVCGAL
jgi:hypothetical protein